MSKAYENAMPRTMNSPARYQPGARSFVDISWTTSSLRRVREELHERVDLARTQRTAVVGRHDPLAEPGRDLRVRLEDRLLDERRALALQGLVEVRAGRAVRARLRDRVAGAAGRRAGRVLAVREDRLGVGRGRLAAAARLTAAAAAPAAAVGGRARAPDPRGEALGPPDPHGRAHEGMAEAAELGADDLVHADRVLL